jgi:hypothetical protein
MQSFIMLKQLISLGFKGLKEVPRRGIGTQCAAVDRPNSAAAPIRAYSLSGDSVFARYLPLLSALVDELNPTDCIITIINISNLFKKSRTDP